MDVITHGDRVARHTSTTNKARLACAYEQRMNHYRQHPHEIPARLEQIDQEWDIERVLETNASGLAFSGVVLAATVHKRFLWLPAVVTAFLFQHALQGWCPPLPVFRRLGYRTQQEIDSERQALREIQRGA